MTLDNVQAILTVVRQVPRGRVASYGQVARIAGIPRNSRQVGSVLKTQTADSDVPWFRIVNSQGRISNRDNDHSQTNQRQLLEKENVLFDEQGRVDLKVFGWNM